MKQISFTDRELAVVTFAVKADLEVVSGDLIEFKEDLVPLQTALKKLEEAEETN